MPITPDTKDWTWVLSRPCAECGFDATSFAAADVPTIIRDNARAWPDLLDRPDVTQRPDDSTWSPLEYGAHVRDIYRLFHERLRLMLAEHDPQFADWSSDDAALAGRYSEQDPKTVAREIVEAGESIADAYDELADEQWSRPGRRSNGSLFTVETLGKYMLHDVVHHAHDVRR
ncbi:DinB family protein [Salinibacterium sp. GXW1014]|uniref:DinB family protein n=1 Tax=Salinibacterium sp. GXW1014 TaxID=3377838 RepID=UPI00383AF8A1